MSATMVARAKTIAWLVLPLLLIAAGLWVTQRRPWTSPRAIAPPTATAPASAVASHAAAAASTDAAPLIAPTRDPFQGPSAPAAIGASSDNRHGALTASTIRLQGIIWGLDPPRAIVNDRILAAGETFQGIQVVAIAPDGVTIDYQGQRAVLRLPSSPSPASVRER